MENPSTIELDNFYKKVFSDKELNELKYNIEESTDINWAQKLDIKYDDKQVNVKILFTEINWDENGSVINVFAKVLYRKK